MFLSLLLLLLLLFSLFLSLLWLRLWLSLWLLVALWLLFWLLLLLPLWLLLWLLVLPWEEMRNTCPLLVVVKIKPHEHSAIGLSLQHNRGVHEPILVKQSIACVPSLPAAITGRTLSLLLLLLLLLLSLRVL